MKKTLLTTTALVALAGAATAESMYPKSGTARLGLQTTEGTAARPRLCYSIWLRAQRR